VSKQKSQDQLSCLEPTYADGIFAEGAVTKAVLFARVDADCAGKS
jgi:hypothetical protein